MQVAGLDGAADGRLVDLAELRVVRVGQRRLVPVAEIERWLDREAMVTLNPEEEP